MQSVQFVALSSVHFHVGLEVGLSNIVRENARCKAVLVKKARRVQHAVKSLYDIRVGLSMAGVFIVQDHVNITQ